MKHFKFFATSILIAFLFVTSCKKDDPVTPVETPTVTVNESEVLVKYLESSSSPAGKDFVNTDLPTMITATDVNSLNLLNQVYIIDIRSAADFATGHIANAHNLALADVFTHIKSTDLSSYEKIAMVCYTGQTAGYATSLLRLLGYNKVYTLKWGMCSWNSATASKWNTAISTGNTYASLFTATSTDKAALGSLPTLSTSKTTGQEILEARVSALFTEGFTPATVSGQTLFANLTNYYIVNYWSAAHYSDPGHVSGAIQYTPKESLKLDVDLKTLPTNKPIAVYCYTGQTSAFVTAYLRLLGYDAKSVLYGANGMIYDIMVSKSMTTFSSSQIMEYDLVASK